MSNGVAKTIKNAATAILIIGIVASIGGGIAMINYLAPVLGFLIIIIGCLIFWTTYVVLRGFSQLVEDTSVSKKISEISCTKDLKGISKRGTCEVCSKKGVDVINCNIVDYAGAHYNKDLCVECMAKNNAEPTEKK